MGSSESSTAGPSDARASQGNPLSLAAREAADGSCAAVSESRALEQSSSARAVASLAGAPRGNERQKHVVEHAHPLEKPEVLKYLANFVAA